MKARHGAQWDRPPARELDLDVIVLNYNTRDHLEAGLTALRAEGSTILSRPDAAITARVIVVDNASSDGSADMVAARFPEAILIRSPRNGGFAYGNNQALRRSGARLVLLLNPDSTLAPGAIRDLVDEMDRHPEAAVVGPRLIRPDGSVHLACRRSFPTPAVSLYRVAGLSRRFRGSPRFGRYNLTHIPDDAAVEVDAVTGACMLARGQAIESVGALDERFFMYGEDLDWCLRFRRAGWTVRFAPHVLVRHQHGAASRQRPWRTTLAFFHAMDLFYRKHYTRRYHPFVSATVRGTIYAGLAAALLKVAFAPSAHRRPEA